MTSILNEQRVRYQFEYHRSIRNDGATYLPMWTQSGGLYLWGGVGWGWGGGGPGVGSGIDMN